MIAKHVMNIHMNRPNESNDENGEAVGEIDIDKMKRYIAYCKGYVLSAQSFSDADSHFSASKCAPRLSPDAQEMLSSHFVSLRKQVQQLERDNDERSSIPITIRWEWSIARILTLSYRSTDNWRPSSEYQNLSRK